ncbi:MAG: glycoside hydrolase family 3 protein [Acetatifactor sp.]|nr:glycoside hydrolase family 3 protein [Acetatifactor sp.]
MADRVFSVEKYAAKAREAVAEGIVLLRNEDGALPLAKGSRIALFGRSQFNYYKSGTGSGGMVNTRYVTGIAEALEQSEDYELNSYVKGCYQEWLKEHPLNIGLGWAQVPWFQEEMPLSRELVDKAAEESDTAVIVIGRTAGEDKDNLVEPGSYLLTDVEEQMLETVCSVFRRTVVLLNVGNIIDMKWVEKYSPSAVLYVWQGGQEGGNGALDVISGRVSPSGRLTDTIAHDIQDYPAAEFYGDLKRNFYAEDIYVGYRYFSTFAPEKVMYPFGYGLSYTTFSLDTEMSGLPPIFFLGMMLEKHTVKIRVRVKNTGECSGKEVVQVYCRAPQGLLGKPARSLCGFAKSDCLAPGEMQELTVNVPWNLLASYDDSGITGHKSCYVLEAGDYEIYVGENVRDACPAGKLTIPQLVVLKQLEEALAPTVEFSHMRPGEQKADGTYTLAWEKTSLRTVDPAKRRLERLPKEYPYTGDLGYRLQDVAAGMATMEQFLGQLTDQELCCAVRGEGMCSPKVTPGVAGAFGGLTESLMEYGLPAACCADGPSGIRMDCGTIAFAMPIGTCLACTFNEELVEELYQWEGMELRKNQIDTLLGPGMNIHRYPLNGRNFEYFSEDPLVSGKLAAAQLRGMHKYGVTGTIKHFACNNQEQNRYGAEAVVSERALREIYLRGFEIAVKEGEARSIMSTYGPMNGFWTASSYDLLTTILRGEWGYTGIVMSDWWAMGNEEGGAPAIQNTSVMVRSQNDLYMVCEDSLTNANGDDSEKGLQDGIVTRGEFQRSVENICRFLLASPAWLRKQGMESELDRELAQCAAEEADIIDGPVIPVSVDGRGDVDPSLIDTSMGKNNFFEVTLKEKGHYQVEITCRITPDTVGAAQMPMSVFADNRLVKTIALTGTDREWEKRIMEIPWPIEKDVFPIKIFFCQSGIEIKEFSIVKKDEEV